MARYDANTPKREGFDAIGVDEQGGEHVLPLLVAGNGVDQKNPPPGTPGWREIVQAGANSAASADPPNEQELAIWRRVAEEEMPLDFVSRNDATLLLRVPKWWPLDRNSMTAEAVDIAALDLAGDREGPFPAPEIQPDVTSSEPDLEELLLGALEAAPFAVTVSQYVAEPIHQGDQHIYPWEAWADVVSNLFEVLEARLLPERDGVVVGHIEEEDLVSQALALLAKAQGK